MVYFIVRNFFKIARFFLFPFKMVGLKNVPRKGAFIFACNHRSYIDPPLMAMCYYRPLAFVARSTLFKGILGWFLPRLNSVPINRESADVSAIKQTLRNLKKGFPVVVFPEGTRTLDPAKRKVLSGVGMIAVKSGLPVVPVYIKGTDDVLPPGAKFPKRRPVSVTFGEVMMFSNTKDYDAVTRQIMDKILSLEK